MEEKVKDNSKLYLVIIAILLLIIGLGVGYFIGTNKVKPVNVLEEKEEPKEEEKTEELVSGKLKSNGEKDAVDITLNGKTNSLEVLDLSKQNKSGSYLTFGDTNLDKLYHYGTGDVREMPEVNYHVIKGTDNKEYLVVTYDTDFQHVLLVINDQTRIVGEFLNKVLVDYKEGYYCFSTFNDSRESTYEISNSISYYKYKDGNITSKELGDDSFVEDSIVLDRYELVIGNNIVKEVKTDSNKNGKISQCT